MPVCFKCQLQYASFHRCKVFLGSLRKCSRMRAGRYYQIMPEWIASRRRFTHNPSDWGELIRELDLAFPAEEYVYKPRTRRGYVVRNELWHTLERTLQWPTDWLAQFGGLIQDSHSTEGWYRDAELSEMLQDAVYELSKNTGRRAIQIGIRQCFDAVHVWPIDHGLIESDPAAFNTELTRYMQEVCRPQKSLDHYLLVSPRYNRSNVYVMRIKPVLWHINAFRDVLAYLHQKVQALTTAVV